MRFVTLLVAGIAGGLIGLPSLGWAAVRVCKAEVSSGPHLATGIAEGHKLAIAAWMQNAKVVGGDSHTSWRLANSKSLTCTPTEGSKVICVARGRPCVIEHVAPKEGVPIIPGPPEPKAIPVPKAKVIKI